LIACAACAHEPAATADAHVVQAIASGPTTGTTTTVSIAPTRAGDWFVIVPAWDGALGWSQVAVTTEPATHFWLNEGARMDCPSASGLWSSIDPIAGGITSVTVTTDTPATFEVYVLEVAGLANGLAGKGMQDDPTGAATAHSPALDAVHGELVVSMVSTCGTVGELVAASPFTELASFDGHGVAFFVAGVAGSYGAEWSYSGGALSSASVSFQ
jgi:hypothetical protein